MTAFATRRMTLEEFAALPEGPPYYEFECGELIPMASPTPRHQDLLAELTVYLRSYLRRENAGRVFMELDVYLPDGRVYVPDLSYLSPERLGLLSPLDQKIYGTPNLAVEVTFTKAAHDRLHKFRVYHDNGVPWYWIVDGTTLGIEEYQHTPEGYLRIASVEAGETFAPKLFPGLTIDLAALLGVTPEAAEANPNTDTNLDNEVTQGEN